MNLTNRSVLSERNANVGDPAYSEVLRLSKEDVSAAGHFLDGCCVHVYGVRDKALLDRLHQIINQAGGLRTDSLEEGVTHVITLFVYLPKLHQVNQADLIVAAGSGNRSVPFVTARP